MARVSSKLLGWLLAVSLAVNVAVIGAVASFVLSGHYGAIKSTAGHVPSRADGHMDTRRQGPPVLGPIVMALDPKERRSLLRALRRAGRDMRDETAADPPAQRAAMVAALRADPFDRAAFETTLDSVRANQDKRAVRSFTVLMDHLDAMTQTERLNLAQKLQETPMRRPKP